MIEQFFEVIVAIFEVLGALAMLVGLVFASVVGVRTWRRSTGTAALEALRRSLGAAILLGLELLVAGDIVRTLIAPSIEDVLVLGVVVLIRTVLSFSLQIEIDGELPWRRAIVTSSPQVIAKLARHQREQAQSSSDEPAEPGSAETDRD